MNLAPVHVLLGAPRVARPRNLLPAAVFDRCRVPDEWVGEGVTIGDYRHDAVLVENGDTTRVIEIGTHHPACSRLNNPGQALISMLDLEDGAWIATE